MRPSINLDGEAWAFWKRHEARLIEEQILNEKSLDSFVLLCQTWGHLQTLFTIQPGAKSFREMVQLGKLHGEFQKLARQFGLLPASAKKDKLDKSRPEKPDEFGL